MSARPDYRYVGAFIPADLDEMGLDPYEFRIYCRICRRGDHYESVDSMAAGCRMADRTVQRILQALTLKGLIRPEIRKGQTTKYHLTELARPTPTIAAAAALVDATPESGSPLNVSHPRTTVTPEPESPKGNPLKGLEESPNGASSVDANASSDGSPSVTGNPVSESGQDKKPRKRKPFVAPTCEEVQAYMLDKGYDRSRNESRKFVNFYGSKGWMVGKSPMVNWKLAVNNWIATDQERRAKEAENLREIEAAAPAPKAAAPSFIQQLSVESNPWAEEVLLGG